MHERDVTRRHGIIEVVDSRIIERPLGVCEDGRDLGNALDELVAIAAGIGLCGVLHDGAVSVDAITGGDLLKYRGNLLVDKNKLLGAVMRYDRHAHHGWSRSR